MEYLVENGHRSIGYLRGDYRIKAFQYREYGYYRTLGRHGLSEAPEYVVTLGTTLEAAYEDMKAYLEGKPALPTAYFADNDVIALGAMRALEEKESKYRIRSLSWDSTISVLGPYPPGTYLQSMYTSRRWERWR